MGKLTGVTLHANDPKAGMTVQELRDFLEVCGRLSVDDGAVIRMVATWRRTIKALSVDVEA